MPFVVSKNIVWSRSVVQAMLSVLDAIPVAVAMPTPFVHLFTVGPAPITPDSVPADFTEAAFAGYAAIALPTPFLGPINVEPDLQGVHEEVDFIAGAVVPPGEMIAGYYVTSQAAAGGNFYLGETFVAPIPIAAVGDFISLDVDMLAAMLLSAA